VGVPEDWHLDKKVSIGNIITLATLIIAATAGYFQVQSLAEENRRSIERHQSIEAHPGGAKAVQDLEVTQGRIEERLKGLEKDIEQVKKEQKEGFGEILRELRNQRFPPHP